MTRTARILLVDDEVAIQRAVEPLLRSRGYDVETVGTGEDALKSVARQIPDLVVLDLGLPGVGFNSTESRVYPKEQLTSHVTGYVHVTDLPSTLCVAS